MKYALVTGGSRGIGRAICIKLASMGYITIINYVSNDEAAEQTKKEIESNGGQAELLKYNVADAKATVDALSSWQSTHPDCVVEVLVNNAGFAKDNLLFWMKDEEWHSVLDVSLNGFFYTTRHLLEQMLTNKYGRIINIVSLSGISGTAGQTNYSAAKAGVIGATKALALEVAKKKVTVNAVAPGFIDTEMVSDLDQKQLKKLVPVKRFGKAEEVADLVGFIASDKSSYITGEVISINGGIAT